MKYLNTCALNAFHIQQCCISMSNIPQSSSNLDSEGDFHLSIDRSPGWIRMAQIGLGAVILVLSILVLINPVMGSVSVIFILALLLFFAGIEKVVSGIIGRGKASLSQYWIRNYRNRHFPVSNDISTRSNCYHSNIAWYRIAS